VTDFAVDCGGGAITSQSYALSATPAEKQQRNISTRANVGRPLTARSLVFTVRRVVRV
jgi:hypothetical protein